MEPLVIYFLFLCHLLKVTFVLCRLDCGLFNGLVCPGSAQVNVPEVTLKGSQCSCIGLWQRFTLLLDSGSFLDFF